MHARRRGAGDGRLLGAEAEDLGLRGRCAGARRPRAANAVSASATPDIGACSAPAYFFDSVPRKARRAADEAFCWWWRPCSSLAAGRTSGTDMGSDGGMRMQTCMPDGKAVALSGRYAVRGEPRSSTSRWWPAARGRRASSTTTPTPSCLLVADLTQTGTSVAATVTPCKIVIPPVALKNQPMPVAADRERRAGGVGAAGDVDGHARRDARPARSFDAQPITIALGASLANTASDPLPTFSSSASPPVVLCGGAATTACASTANPVGPTDHGVRVRSGGRREAGGDGGGEERARVRGHRRAVHRPADVGDA